MLIALVGVAAVLLSADPNDEGFAAYQAGDLGKAKRLFEQAQRRTPKNAWAWLNWARVVVKQQTAKQEYGGCVWATPWAIQALVGLDRALELSRDAVQKKIDADEDGALAPLKKTQEYEQWVAAHKPLPKATAEIEAILAAHPGWHEETLPPSSWRFGANHNVAIGPPGAEKPETASWRADGAQLIVTRGKNRETFSVVADPWAFDQGTKSFRRLRLTSSNPGRDLYLDEVAGPGDCP